jgi:hypothetical protein
MASAMALGACADILDIPDRIFDADAASKDAPTNPRTDGGHDAVADGPSRADAAADALPDGTCGHDCLGGACVDGQCRPLTLTTSLAPKGVALDTDNVYWTSSVLDGGVYSVPKDGGETTVIEDHIDIPSVITSDSVGVVYSLGTPLEGHIDAHSFGSSGSFRLASGTWLPLGLAVDLAYVYWVTWAATTGKLFRLRLPSTDVACDIAPGQCQTLADSIVYGQGMAMYESSVFWTAVGTTSGSVSKVVLPADGGAPADAGSGQLLAGAQSMPAAIVIDGAYIYWADQGSASASNGSILRSGLDGGQLTTLAAGLDDPFAIALDPPQGAAARVYWTARGSGTIACVPAQGGTVVTVATGEAEPTGIALDDVALYWSDLSSGAIRKLAK